MSLIQNLNETYIIAEIGQNHNGDINIAKKLIDQLDVYPYDEVTGNRLNKVNAIKLTKRDLSEELSKEGMKKTYNNPNSFGKTYGEHRESLELNYEEHAELGRYIKSKGFDFVETLCSVSTLKLLNMVEVDKIKVASRDLTNIPLLEALAKTNKPIILSTGMAEIFHLHRALKILKNSKVSILHCLSQYPAEYERLNMNTIPFLQETHPDKIIGYSDHSLGIHIPIMAVTMGAKIIEKHVTLDKNMKGTDQKGSAEPQEVKQMVHDIRTVEMSFGKFNMFQDESTLLAAEKLERSLAYKQDLLKNTILKEEHFHMISPGSGLKWEDKKSFIGKNLKHRVESNTLVKKYDI
tara:strand:+ start:511 stop:1560 length:1050 start_codon:yes stop_codon:yes gene_type:complete